MNEAMYALNFYSPIVAEQLRSGRKTATIRLGDKSAKYRKGMIVQVLAGARFSPRERVFNAVIDKVEVKLLADLSPREVEHDNPELVTVRSATEFGRVDRNLQLLRAVDRGSTVLALLVGSDRRTMKCYLSHGVCLVEVGEIPCAELVSEYKG